MPTPPRFWRWLLCLLVPRDEREFVVGDLDEEFRKSDGGPASVRWYRSQAVRSLSSLLTERLGRTVRALTQGNLMKRLTASLDLDLKQAFRRVLATPGFSALVVLTLAIGTGAAVAIFSAVNSVLLRELPFQNSERLVMLWESNQERGWVRVDAAPANVLDWAERVEAFEDVGYFSRFTTNTAVRVSDEAVSVRVGDVSWNLFQLLGRAPMLGRLFTEDENWQGPQPSVILGYAVWSNVFGGDSNLVGKTIDLDGSAHVVVGVMPRTFEYPLADAEAWTTPGWPRSSIGEIWFRRAHIVGAVARLRAGFSMEVAASQLEGVASDLEREYPVTNTSMEAGLTPLKAFLVKDQRTPLLLLLGGVVLLLLIGSSNVANLFLVRTSGRRKEIAVRTSLGASRTRVARMLLVESLIFGSIGTVVGIGVSGVALRIMQAVEFEGLPDIHLAADANTILFVLSVTLANVLFFGVVPALRMSRANLRDALSEGGRGGSAGRGSGRLANLLISAEVSLAVLLVTAAGLTVQTFRGLFNVEDGIDSENVLTFRMSPPSGLYSDYQRTVFAVDVIEKLNGVAGVAASGVARTLPLDGYGWTSDFSIEGWGPDEFGIDVAHREVLPGYFDALSVPVLEGRMFDQVITEHPVPVVVNEAFRDKYFPDDSPVGRSVSFDREPDEDSYWYRIVAVVGNERMNIQEDPKPEIISHLVGDTPSTLTFVVKASVDPIRLVSVVRERIAEVDAGIPIYDIRTLNQVRRTALGPERFAVSLFGSLALAALLLAFVGVYGVAAEASRSRVREVSIRVALGASRGLIVRQFLGRILRWSLGGVIVGTLATVAAGRLMESLLWGVEPTDPITLITVAVIMSVAALLAGYLPARRASRADPVAVLKAE